MCHKETNTDWLQRAAIDSADQSHREIPIAAEHSQSRSEGSHNTSIRRWQTFSPPGITEDSYVCKVCLFICLHHSADDEMHKQLDLIFSATPTIGILSFFVGPSSVQSISSKM